jgi:FlaA1/EpsC-like NDP-sugar epimerase
MNDPFSERCVLLTGAGGSIGSALAKAIIRHGPRSLVLLDHSEGNLYQIHLELSAVADSGLLHPIVGDICDKSLLSELFGQLKPEIVIHAAAFKHVPLMERNLIAAVQNNTIGTNVLARIARTHDVSTFVMVSTDKAVNPHSVMGATKKLAELALLRWSGTRTSMRAVRLVNVLGTRGSVVPVFLQQISEGGPLTVTHPNVNRYFMSMEQAVEVVLSTAKLAGVDGIFVPNTGEAVRIVELARRLIREAGFEPESEMRISMTGLRPGDKLSEELVSQLESIDSTFAGSICSLKSPQLAEDEFDSLIEDLEQYIPQRSSAAVFGRICQFLPEYRPSKLIRDVTRKNNGFAHQT